MAKDIQLALEIGANFSEAVTLPSTQTGRTHRAHIRETIGSTTVKLAFSTGAGNITLSDNTVTLTAGADVTELLNLTTDSAFWVIDIESIGATAADVRREARGTVLVTRDITRTTESTAAANASKLLTYSTDDGQTLTDPEKAALQVKIGVGGSSYPLQFGEGYMRFGAFVAQTLSPYDATAGAANAASVPLYMRPGRGTGNGDGAGVVIQVAQPGDSGADPHNLVDAYELGVTQFATSNPLRLPNRTEGDSVGAGIDEGSFTVGADGKLLAAVGGLWVDRSGTRDYNDLLNLPALGTAALLNVPVSGNASSGQVVLGSDTRLNTTTIVTLQNVTTSQAVPIGTQFIRCQVWGQGGPGGSGRKGATGTVACGGGAGSSSMYVEIWVAAADVGSSIACVIPGAPAGGAAVTTDNTDGNPGAARTNTTVQLGQYTITVPGGVPGSGGTTVSGTGGSSSGSAFVLPFISVAGSLGAGASATGATGNAGGNNTNGNAGSGAGGGVTAANAAGTGGAGGYCQISNTQIAGGAGGTAGVNGSPGTAPTGFHGAGGSGGGGGAVTGAAGAGANGVGYGGAGGGGGGARNGVGNSSGKGGDGTPGTVRFTFIP